MNNVGRSLGTITLEDAWVQDVVDLVAEELQVPSMDIEQRESLERVVMMSIAFYFMFARESMSKTSKLTQ